MRPTSEEAGLVADAQAAIGEPVPAPARGIRGLLVTEAAAEAQGVTVRVRPQPVHTTVTCSGGLLQQVGCSLEVRA